MLRVNVVNDVVELLSHHAKKPYKASSYVSATGQQQQRLYVALARLVAAGFAVDTDGQRLKVAPAALLTAAQRDWIQTNKPALVSAVSTPVERWCIEYPRSRVAADSGTRCVADYLPFTDWRRVSTKATLKNWLGVVLGLRLTTARLSARRGQTYRTA